MSADASSAGPPSEGGSLKRFGAFSGVFTPSILTILGVIMYMRVGWATGQVGLLGILAIVVLAHLITAATGLSISAIATNRTVGAGGAYNIISRSLGAPAGAAIGIPLFLAQALSVTFYIVGFTESLRPLFPDMDERLVGSLVLAALVLISAKSAELAIKAQYVILVIIGLSLISLFGGEGPAPPTHISWVADGGAGFGAVFAVFFPAVTGIMAGVGMSGDLRDPRKSLPRGTLIAIGVGFVVYLAIPVWLAMNASSYDLVEQKDIVWRIAAVPSLIFMGVWGATLSSALGSILTAPRTLQALASDGLAPGPLGRGFGPANEPRAALALTFGLAEIGILLGNLDAIAPILTMFFLATYGITNLACGLERWAASPGFRPAFSVPAWVSLAGAAACFYVMSIINLPAMIAAIVFCGTIFVMTERRDLKASYGDARHGIWAALVRSALMRLKSASFHPGNWRPNLLILGGDPKRRPYLLHLGSAIVQERGIVTYVRLLIGSVREHRGERQPGAEAMQAEFGDQLPNVFFRVEIVPAAHAGIVSVAQSYGLGNFEANSVMLSWSSRPEARPTYLDALRDLTMLDRNLLLVQNSDHRGFGDRKSIHVWWGGLKGNGGLMLLLSHLLTGHRTWRQAQITVITVVGSLEAAKPALENLERIIGNARIAAVPRVLVSDGRSILKIMESESGGADLVILGIRLPQEPVTPDVIDPWFDRLDSMLAVLPTTILLRSARTFVGEPVLFEMDEE